ncbi:MAG: DUF4373 domain-containing protein [Bacteroides sp.]|nr:DUF4373 domain-containing protein [Bacteroides sp.]
MSRIKKRGLDYFPMNTDFIHDRLVRRILKREGDAALAVLLQTLCSIYSGEGYYVLADRLFYDDLADSPYQQEASDVERIISLAVEYGLFDATLFEKCHVLTSADIQRQFLFITKRRNSSTIDACYNLLPTEEPVTGPLPATLSVREKDAAGNDMPEGISAAESDNRVTFQSENSENAPQSTQSIAQQSIAQQTKENSLLDSSPGIGGTEGADAPSAEEVYLRKIENMHPPQDGLKRNLEGLLLNLRQLRIPVQQQYAIVLKSNFGVIGHPMWKGFGVLRDSHGKIRQPGNYLLSLCR